MPIGPLWAIDLALAGGSIAVLLALLYVYGSSYRQLRSPFALGLVLFAALFIVENLASIFFYVSMADAGEGSNVALPILVLGVAELVAFTALFVVTWR